MTPEFKETMREAVVTWRDLGVDPVAALRDVEISCGRANEEFAGHGKDLVEEVYGGTFRQRIGGQGYAFVQAAPVVAHEDQPQQNEGDEADGAAQGIQERGGEHGEEAGDFDEGSERGTGGIDKASEPNGEEEQPEPEPSSGTVTR